MNRIAATLVAMIAAAAVLLGPAPSYADEPTPTEPDPCATYIRAAHDWEASANYWRGAYLEGRESWWDERSRLVGERNTAQERAAETARVLGQRTEERDTLLHANQRQSKRIVRLKARIRDLRAQLGKGLVG